MGLYFKSMRIREGEGKKKKKEEEEVRESTCTHITHFTCVWNVSLLHFALC